MTSTNIQAMRAHWLPIVEKCATERTASRLPSLEQELGEGRYKISGDKLLSLPDTHYRYRLQWRTTEGKLIKIGCFDAPHSVCSQGTSVEDELYRDAVETCERQGGSTVGIPGLEHILGAGKYKCEAGDVRKDGRIAYIMYWKLDHGGKYMRLGSFVLDSTTKDDSPKSRTAEERESLALGVDDLGRKIIRVSVSPNRADYLCAAVEFEMVKGQWMPKPSYDAVARGFNGGKATL